MSYVTNISDKKSTTDTTLTIKKFPYLEVDAFFKKIEILKLSHNKNYSSKSYFDDDSDSWKEHDYRFQYVLDYGFILIKITAYNVPSQKSVAISEHHETVEFKIKDTDNFFIPIDSITDLEEVFMKHYNSYIPTVIETIKVNKSFEALTFSSQNLIQAKIFVNSYYEIKTLTNHNGENIYTLQDVYNTEFSGTENLDSLNIMRYGTSKISDTLIMIKENDILVKDSNDYVHVMSLYEFENKFKTRVDKKQVEIEKPIEVKKSIEKSESTIEFQKNILLDMIKDSDVIINIYSTMETQSAKENVLKSQLKKDMVILMYEELFNPNYPNI